MPPGVVDVVTAGWGVPELLALATGICALVSVLGGRGFGVALGTAVSSLEID